MEYEHVTKRLGSRVAYWVIAAVAAAISFAPAAQATPISYDFSVNVTSGPLSGNTYNGSFSYDSSSIISGGYNNASGLLTALNFSFDGTTYDATSANTGWLGFDAAGNLDSFVFGNNCPDGTCTVQSGYDQFYVIYAPYASPPGSFVYSMNGWNQASIVNSPETITFAPATVHVPEPGSLGLFCFGTLLLLAASLSHRRWTFKRIES